MKGKCDNLKPGGFVMKNRYSRIIAILVLLSMLCLLCSCEQSEEHDSERQSDHVVYRYHHGL